MIYVELDKLIEKIAAEVLSKVASETKGGGSNSHSSAFTSISRDNTNIASRLEHSLLKPDAKAEEIKKLCQEAREYKFTNVCVSPWYVPLASQLLKDSGVQVCTVAGFPHGTASTAAKVAEVREAIENGAAEIDVALNFTALKSGDFDAVKKDIEAVIAAAKGKVKIKAIIETCLLTDEEKVKGCTIAKIAGADFIKISTFLGTGKASPDEVKFIRNIVGPEMGIKSDGGVKDYDGAIALINAGATRIGASASINIVKTSGSSNRPKDAITTREIAKYIDHSLLRPELTVEELIEGCRIAREYNCISVCVRPTDLPIVKKELAGTDVLITTVIGFPHGSHSTETKVFEAIDAIKAGAVEIDMVLNIGRLRSREFDYVENDIKAVVDAAHARGALVKVIFENCYLTDELKEISCRICEKVGADFVKTSTGYGKSGATIEDLKLMRRVCSPKVQVKAAGGVKTLDAALAVISTGTVRIGTRSTREILDEAMKREKEGTLRLSDQGKLGGGY